MPSRAINFSNVQKKWLRIILILAQGVGARGQKSVTQIFKIILGGSLKFL